MPTRFLLCRDDRLPPADFLRRVVRERLGIAADEIDGGHCVALSRPKELAERLDAYRALQMAAYSYGGVLRWRAATCSLRIREPPWPRGMIHAMTVGGARAGRRVATAVLLVLVAAACIPAERPRPRPAASWQRVDPGGATRCARGGRYAFWARVADPSKLVVSFQGGGGCFDERSCAVGSTWFDDSVTDADDPTHAGGMLSMTDPRNPFQEWSWVFIPSCGGDVHLGDRRVRYDSVTVQQRGWQNAHAAMDWAFAHFPNPDAVLVTGCSAGSVGSAFHVPAILDHWPRARVAQVGDSLAFVFHRPVNLSGWGAPVHFPAFFRIGERPFTMVEYLTALGHRYPRLVFARFNHAGDDVQERFYRGVGGDPAEFEGRLRAAETALKRLPNYRSYLACGDEHCSFGSEAFYTTQVNGVALRGWVADLAAGRDVSCPLCRGS